MARPSLLIHRFRVQVPGGVLQKSVEKSTFKAVAAGSPKVKRFSRGHEVVTRVPSFCGLGNKFGCSDAGTTSLKFHR